MDRALLDNLSSLVQDLDPQMVAQILGNLDPQTLNQLLSGVLNMMGNNSEGLAALLKNFLPK